MFRRAQTLPNDMIALLAFLLVTSLMYYVLFLHRVRRGLGALNERGLHSAPEFVSIVVAARNEEANILTCLQSLLNQQYPSDKYEIIVVDDGSTDRTVEELSRFAREERALPVIVVSLKDGANVYGKPYAIARGLEKARGEIILCTDADCIVPQKWMASMVRRFEPDVAFVAGPVIERPQGSFFSRLSSLEFLGIITTAAGLIGNGTPIFCNGANIGYRKSIFTKVEGFGTDSATCDDETLLQRISVRSAGRIDFNADSDAVVETKSAKSIADFWSQRVRWASKKGHYEDPTILWRLVVLNLFFVFLLTTAIASLFDARLWPVALAAFLTKALVDYLTLKRGAVLMRQHVLLHQFAVAELLHVPYIVIAVSIAQLKSIGWKERTLER